MPWLDRETGKNKPFTTGERWQTITIPLTAFGNYTNTELTWSFQNVIDDKNGIHGGLLWLSIYSTTSYLFYSYRASPQFFSMGVGTALRRTEWWMGFHSTFIKSAAKEMGRYVSMNRGKVRV